MAAKSVVQPDQILVSCAIEATMNILGGKWKPLILFHLIDDVRRFNELQRLIPHVTREMLTQHLRQLETDGIVHREVYPQVPPKVEYSLTPLGKTLLPLLDAMGTWGERYQEQYLNKNQQGPDTTESA